MSQLALPLPVAPRFGREDFMVSASNEAAWQMVEAWPAWPANVLLLIGPTGAGKSHVAAIWAARAKAATLAARDLAEADVATLAPQALVLEDADRDIDEASLFHLLNLFRQRDTSLVITARSGPQSWGLRLPDLLSRLRAAPAVEIGAPDDALMRAVLIKHFHDRQLSVDTNVVDYLGVRIERSLDAARQVVDALDRASLEERRAVTRPMAAVVLARIETGAELDAGRPLTGE